MEKKLAAAAERYLNSLRQNKRRTQLLRCVAVLVVVATISALMMPALTMSNEVECGLDEHVHTEACWSEQLALPEAELTCTAGSSGTAVIHIHDERCYDSQSNLICGLPEVEAHVHGEECYQEHRTLLCEQAAEVGHQHDAACYAYVRVENAAAEETVSADYTCGMQEGEGAHRHMEECYPEERAAEPLCGLEETGDEYDDEGNLLWQGHRHNDECWLVRIHEKLICGQEESEDEYDDEGNLIREGHAHANSCWLTGDALCLRYGCGQQESVGHVHTDACSQGSVQVDAQGEQWEQVLVCGEQEREPGHVHDDGCYEITQVLTCRRQELTAHTHDEGCCGEDGALICGKTEALAHQHTDACFVVPEGGPEPTRVLVCGMEEHTHTDLCYVKTLPEEETETFYCGQEEHVHNLDECYFQSGALKCTLTEHIHDLFCEMPPEESDDPEESGDPEESQSPEPGQEDESHIWVDEPYVYETEAFQVVFHITGYVKPVVQADVPVFAPESSAAPELSVPEVIETPPIDNGLVELMNQMVPLAALPSFDSDVYLDSRPPETDEYSDSGATGSEPVGTAVDNSSPADLPDPGETVSAEPGEPALPGESETENLPQQEAVEFAVEVMEEDDPGYQALLESVEDLPEEDESILRQGLRLTCSLGDLPMDLSECEITAVIKPSQALVQAANQDEGDVMAAQEDGVSDSLGTMEDEENFVPTMTVYTAESMAVLPLSAEEDEPETEPVRLPRTGEIVVDVDRQVYPTFTVQYEGLLKTVETDIEAAPAGYDTLSVIDTSGGNLPTNGSMASEDKGYNLAQGVSGKIKNMYVSTQSGSKGSILMKDDTQPIYMTHIFNYRTAKKLSNIDIVTATNNGHYDLKEIWIRYPITAEKDSVTGEMTYTYDDAEDSWLRCPYNDATQLTNREDVAKDKDNFIWIADGAQLKLVYEPVQAFSLRNAKFFDYDVSDGKVYKSNQKSDDNLMDRTTTPSKDNKWYLYTNQQGINNGNNYTGAGNKLAFGNNNIKTGELGDEKKGSYYINQANINVFRRCSFGLVKQQMENGKLVFADGVQAPDLFGENSASATGRTDYNNGSLTFDRKGDTYTLTSATIGNSGASGLDTLDKDRWSWDKKLHMYSNEFWPLDKVRSAGTAGHDPMFGGADNYWKEGELTRSIYNSFDTNGKDTSVMPSADYGVDHNAYFGMKFEVTFKLTPEYIGPLEYYFFGDDDMWVYLDGKLVCDIGGVHQSVGAYVNLWDYIDRDPKNYKPVNCENGEIDKNPTPETHTLTFYYTERGASGSTCWMQFTLPSVTTSTYVTSDELGGLRIEKEVEGVPTDETFEFKLELTDENGEPLTDLALGNLIYKEGTNGNQTLVTAPDEVLKAEDIRLSLSSGQAYVIKDLPVGTRFTLTELDSKGYRPSFQVTTRDGGSNGNVLGTVTSPSGETVITGTITYNVDSQGKPAGGHFIDIKCINSATYELPSTGGAGSWYTMACLPLTTAALCLWYKKKSKGEGAGG